MFFLNIQNSECCSDLNLISETTNPFRHFGRTPWMGDRPFATPLPTQDSTTQTRTYINASSGIRYHDPNVPTAQDHIHFGTWLSKFG